MNQEQEKRIRSGQGFVAALDQSGGSTPKALADYGISRDQYSTDDEMFNLVHAMAGDAAARKGERGVLAGEVARELRPWVNLQ